jgi:hypothetical protein
VRIIPFNLTTEGVVYLITLYSKSQRSNAQADEIKRAQS